MEGSANGIIVQKKEKKNHICWSFSSSLFCAHPPFPLSHSFDFKSNTHTLKLTQTSKHKLARFLALQLYFFFLFFFFDWQKSSVFWRRRRRRRRPRWQEATRPNLCLQLLCRCKQCDGSGSIRLSSSCFIFIIFCFFPHFLPPSSSPSPPPSRLQ